MSPRPPAHVQQAIEARTGLPLGLASGQAKLGYCPDCGVAVLAGYDSPRCAGLAITDPYRATPLQEYAATTVLHLCTWQLWNTPGNYELTNRTYPRMPLTIQLPSAAEVPVLIEHRCGARLATGPTIPMRLPRNTAPSADTPCPF